jgi:hypothetical protein
MAKIMTLAGTSERSLAGPTLGTCKCVENPRTKRSVQLCYVGKSPKHRSGWQFTKGGSLACRR